MKPRKEAVVRIAKIVSGLPQAPYANRKLREELWLKTEKPMQRPDIKVSQIKRALMGVIDKKTGCEFLEEYGSPIATESVCIITIEQLIGLANTIALAEKLIKLKETSYDRPDRFFHKENRWLDAQFSPDSEIGKWLKEQNKYCDGKLLRGTPEYFALIDLSTKSNQKRKQVKALSKLEKESIEARKKIEREAYCLGKLSDLSATKAERELWKRRIRRVINYRVVQADTCLPLNTYSLPIANWKPRQAAIATVVSVIDQMIATLKPKLQLVGEDVISTYEASDWWSTVALHYRERLLESVTRECLDCGKEMLEVKRSTRKYCDRLCRQRADAKKKAQ